MSTNNKRKSDTGIGKKMLTIHIANNQRGKWYIGTPRRIIKEKAIVASWVDWFDTTHVDIITTDASKSDINRLTLRYMKEHGIGNVRGGSYSDIILSSKQLSHLNEKLGIPAPEYQCRKCCVVVPTAIGLVRHEGSCHKLIYCKLCGRDGHDALSCFSNRSIDGVVLFDRETNRRLVQLDVILYPTHPVT